MKRLRTNKEYIEKLREESGYTTKKFAEIGGLKALSYSAIKTTQANDFSYKSIVRWAIHFNKPIGNFFIDEEHVKNACSN